MDSLDLLSEIFTKYMDPDENADPLVPYSLLPQILAELDLPDLAFPDLDTDGYIQFEPFVNTLSPLIEDKSVADEIGLQRSIFHILSRGNSIITPETLREASKPLGLNVSDEDLESMCRVFASDGVSKGEFSSLWAKLNPR